MSIRVDSSSLISGAVVVGVPGLGVLAENIPTTGEHGGGIAATWLGPEDAGKEVRVLVTSWPAVGSLFVFEDTSFDYDGESTSFEAQLYLDGVAVGTPQPVTITVGGESADLVVSSATHTHTADTPTLSAGLTLVIQSASHPHSVDAVALAAGLSLNPHGASHTHSADNAQLSTALTLSAADSLHTHGADNIDLLTEALTTYLSFPTAIEITATSARPQVTITYPG